MSCLYKLKNWWSEFIKPTRPFNCKEIPSYYDGFATLVSLQDDEPSLESAYDLKHESIFVRSWLLPWKKYQYIPIGEERIKNDRFILYSQKGYPVRSDGHKYSRFEWGNLIVESLKDSYKNVEPWFPSSRRPHHLLRLKAIYKV